MILTSTIRYDRNEPAIMKMVWDEWLKLIKQDDWPDSNINNMYDMWITGETKLIIPQEAWSKIVATYL